MSINGKAFAIQHTHQDKYASDCSTKRQEVGRNLLESYSKARVNPVSLSA